MNPFIIAYGTLTPAKRNQILSYVNEVWTKIGK